MRRRQAFTLIELLVVMALITLIMAIISQAFVDGLETFRQLKAIGDLQENLRSAVVPLREDLIARHLNGATGPVRVSELGPLVPPPIEGYFRIEAPSPSLLEGYDPDQVPSYSATDHALLFTIYTAATASSRRTDWLSTVVPTTVGPAPGQPSPLQTQGWRDYQQPGLFLSPWAEVSWFLVPMIDPTSGTQVMAGGGNTPLFSLHRRIRLLVTDATVSLAINGATRELASNRGLYPEVSNQVDPNLSTFLYFPKPSEVASTPLRRGGMMTTPTGLFIDRTPMGTPPENAGLVGSDRVIADVVSFQVQVLPAGATSFVDLSGPFAGVYDTATTPAAQRQIRALQITIRVWDYKTEQTRQITVIQDM